MTATKFEPRISLITLGVSDLRKSRRFYEEGLGFEASSISSDDIVFLKTNGALLALFPTDHLAKDATVPPEGSGFRKFTISHNVREKSQVEEVLQIAQAAGAQIIKPAQDVFWGGYSGYFSDPDGHLWEICWNPYFELDEKGEIELP